MACITSRSVMSISIDDYNDNILEQSNEFKKMKRQISLCELLLNSIEEENKRLSNEIKEIKKNINKSNYEGTN